VKKVEHIGLAVNSLEQASQLFDRLFGKKHYKTEQVESEGVATSFYQIGDTKIELLEATNPDSPIAKFIEKRGEGMHHIAFHVENIDVEIQRLKNEGFQIINENPKPGADNKMVCFIHPKDTHGVLVELCQDLD